MKITVSVIKADVGGIGGHTLPSNGLLDAIRKTVKDVYIPVTVGGGIRSIDDVKHILRCGAEKVAINTAVTKRPELIKEVSRKFGSQCMVLSIEAKKIDENQWEVYTENRRQKTKR